MYKLGGLGVWLSRSRAFAELFFAMRFVIQTVTRHRLCKDIDIVFPPVLDFFFW